MAGRHSQIASLAGWLVLPGRALLPYLRQIQDTLEKIMAKFEGLDADLAELKQAVADAAARVEAALDRMVDDTADQAAVDAAEVEVRETITALKSIAPDTTPADGEPTQPVEGTSVEGGVVSETPAVPE